MPTPAPKLLAISSGGGHWVELLRLRPAFAGCRVIYATVKSSYEIEVRGECFHVVQDANRWKKWELIKSAFVIFRLLLRERPDIVVSTGAAAGFFGVSFGRLMGARTIWVDSIANAGELSLSGKKIRSFASLWLTQWPHLTGEKGPKYLGSVL